MEASTAPNRPFIISIHAMQRMEERFPEIADELSDDDLGAFIHEEVSEAIEAGRFGSMPPLELISYARGTWGNAPRKDTYAVWTEDKLRGYRISETSEELIVLTVLVGTPREKKQAQLKGRRRR